MNIGRFATYAAVGLAGTAVQYAALIGCVQAGIASPPIASFAGALFGAAVNYALNHCITFRGSRNHLRAASRFFAVAACGIAANWAGMTVLSGAIGLQYLVAQAATTMAVLALTYVANAAWSFRPTPEAA